MKTALMETTTLANGLTKPGAPAQLIMMHTRTAKAGKTETVSYTHLTLPTILRV